MTAIGTTVDHNAPAATSESGNSARRLPWYAFPAVVAALHLLPCLALTFDKSSSDGSWHWFPMFIVDLPISILFLSLQDFFPDAVLFGAFGTLWWFLLASCLVGVINLARRERARNAKATRETRSAG